VPEQGLVENHEVASFRNQAAEKQAGGRGLALRCRWF